MLPARGYGSFWTLGGLSRPHSTGGPRALRGPRRLLARSPKPQVECLPEHSVGKCVGSQVSPRMVAHRSARFFLFGALVPPPPPPPRHPDSPLLALAALCAAADQSLLPGSSASSSLPRVLRSLQTPAAYAEPLGLSHLLSAASPLHLVLKTGLCPLARQVLGTLARGSH